MTLWPLAVFSAALVIASASPGPAVVTLVARVLVSGGRANLGFAAGLLLGDLAWLVLGVFGAATLASEAHALFVALKYAGALYLLYLAARMWTAEPQLDPAAVPSRGGGWGVWGGLSLALANPKTMMFYMALVPTLIDVTHLDAAMFAALCAVVAVVVAAVDACYIVAASRARRLFRSPRALRYANCGGSVVIAGAAVAVAARA
ncbi:MAG TPA: LysE family translocator [Alphaproteobacteria bacterium]|nr:LysE family translocator [Alphaproteobacteria bacterium]